MKLLSSLEQRVHGTNFLNKRRLETLNSIKDEFSTLEGKKVQLSNGEKSKKFTLKSGFDKSNTIINGHKVNLSFQWWYKFSYGSLILETKVCISGGSYDVQPNTAFCQYIESSDYIGDLKDQFLNNTQKINDCIEYVKKEVSKPLDVELFNQQKEQYRKALKELEILKSKVNHSLRDFLPKYA